MHTSSCSITFTVSPAAAGDLALSFTLLQLPQRPPWCEWSLIPLALVLAFLVDVVLFCFQFRKADTACVCSDLSGLKYCYAGDATQTFGNVFPSPSSLLLSKDTLISTQNKTTDFSLFSSSLLIYFWVSVHQILLESYGITHIYKYILGMCQVRTNIPWSPMLEASVHFAKTTFWLLSVCKYVWVLWSTVCSEAEAYGCCPLQRVVRHIFIHIGIFYIWITGLFNKLQYSAMYFYIVSSFLFKDRCFFFFLVVLEL